MDSLRLLELLSMGYLFGVAPNQVHVPTLHRELVAGPRESVSPSGIDGVFFNIETSSEGPVGHQQIVWQTINIRVYHRQVRKETSGWFATKDKASSELYSMQDDQSFTLFDGERLRIHFTDITDLKPLTSTSPSQRTHRLGRGLGCARAKP